MLLCIETIEASVRIATKGKRYKLIERRSHPMATHGHVVIKGDDGKLHTLPDTCFQ